MKQYFSQWLKICVESELYFYYIVLGVLCILALFSGQFEGLRIAFAMLSFASIMHSLAAFSK